MIDVHSHVIPCVDDGCSSLEKAIELLTAAKEEGIDRMVCTPHFRQGQFTENREVIEQAFHALAENNPTGVELFLGQEITVDKTSERLLKEGELLTMNGSEYVLLEYPYYERFDIATSVYELSLLGFKPIVAHAERYEYLTLCDCGEILSSGGLIQINASSLFLGRFASPKKRATEMLDSDCVSFVASDVHFFRSYNMKKAKEYVKKRYGEERAAALFQANAEKILSKQG